MQNLDGEYQRLGIDFDEPDKEWEPLPLERDDRFREIGRRRSDIGVVREALCSNSSAANIGAMQIAGQCRKRTAVVSRAPSKANACGASARAEIPAIARALVRKWRRVCLIGI